MKSPKDDDAQNNTAFQGDTIISQLQTENSMLQHQLKAADDQHRQQLIRLRMQLETERRLAKEAIAGLESQLGEQKLTDGDSEEADMTTTKLQLLLLEENAQLRQTLLDSVNQLAEMAQISAGAVNQQQQQQQQNDSIILTGILDDGVADKSSVTAAVANLSILMQSTEGDSTALQVRLRTSIEAVRQVFAENESLADRLKHAQHCEHLLRLQHVEEEKQWQQEKQTLLLQLQSHFGGAKRQEDEWRIKCQQLTGQLEAINKQLVAQAADYRQQLQNKVADAKLLRDQQSILHRELEDSMGKLQQHKQQLETMGREKNRLERDLLKAGELNRQLRLSVKVNEETFQAAMDRLNNNNNTNNNNNNDLAGKHGGGILDDDLQGLEDLEYLWQRGTDTAVEPLIIALKAQLTHYKQQIVAARQEVTMLHGKIEELKRDHLSELTEMKFTWRPVEQLQSLEQQLDESEQDRQEMRKQRESDVVNIRQLREQCRERADIIESIQAELDAAKQSVKSANKSVARKDSLLQQTREKMEQLEAQMNHNGGSMEDLQSKLQGLQQKLAEKERQCVDLQKQQRQTKEQISTRISRLPNPEKITELAEQVSVLKKELTLKTQRIASLHQQLKSLVEDNRIAKDGLNEITVERNRLREELTRVEGRLHIVSRERKELALRVSMDSPVEYVTVGPPPPPSTSAPANPPKKVPLKQALLAATTGSTVTADPIYRKADDIARTIFNMSLAEILSSRTV